MANTLEYVLNLRDGMSAKLKAVGVSADSAKNKFAELEKQTQGADRLLKAMGGSVGAVQARVNAFKKCRLDTS